MRLGCGSGFRSARGEAGAAKPLENLPLTETGAALITTALCPLWHLEPPALPQPEQGEIYVVQAGPEFKLLAVNKMEETCMATPAISQGTLFFRTRNHLVAIAE